jgi:hypothetical protein
MLKSTARKIINGHGKKHGKKGIKMEQLSLFDV